jgi:hypothetical protein
MLYQGLRRLDAARGVTSWDEALDWLGDYESHRPIREVQYWGHGKWGLAKVDRQRLGIEALGSDHPLHGPMKKVAARMLPGDQGLWWFRTCETFGARPGQKFARALSDFLGCRTAGHTFIIGHWQSGLHSLMPGQDATWSDEEGLSEGTPEEPKKAHWSRLSAPHTITFLHGQIPAGY